MTSDDLTTAAEAAMVLFGGCIAAGLLVGLVLAFTNSWRA